MLVYDGDVVTDPVNDPGLADCVRVGEWLSVAVPVWLAWRLSDRLDVKLGPVADFVNETEKL